MEWSLSENQALERWQPPPPTLRHLYLVLSGGGFISFHYVWLFSRRWAAWPMAASKFYILQLGQKETGGEKERGCLPEGLIKKFQRLAGLEQSTQLDQ